jgi:hypothetical protein
MSALGFDGLYNFRDCAKTLYIKAPSYTGCRVTSLGLMVFTIFEDRGKTLYIKAVSYAGYRVTWLNLLYQNRHFHYICCGNIGPLIFGQRNPSRKLYVRRAAFPEVSRMERASRMERPATVESGDWPGIYLGTYNER